MSKSKKKETKEKKPGKKKAGKKDEKPKSFKTSSKANNVWKENTTLGNACQKEWQDL